MTPGEETQSGRRKTIDGRSESIVRASKRVRLLLHRASSIDDAILPFPSGKDIASLAPTTLTRCADSSSARGAGLGKPSRSTEDPRTPNPINIFFLILAAAFWPTKIKSMKPPVNCVHFIQQRYNGYETRECLRYSRKKNYVSMILLRK